MRPGETRSTRAVGVLRAGVLLVVLGTIATSELSPAVALLATVAVAAVIVVAVIASDGRDFDEPGSPPGWRGVITLTTGPRTVRTALLGFSGCGLAILAVVGPVGTRIAGDDVPRVVLAFVWLGALVAGEVLLRVRGRFGRGGDPATIPAGDVHRAAREAPMALGVAALATLLVPFGPLPLAVVAAVIATGAGLWGLHALDGLTWSVTPGWADRSVGMLATVCAASGALAGTAIAGIAASRYGTSWGVTVSALLLALAAASTLRPARVVADDVEAAIDRSQEATLTHARAEGPVLSCEGIDAAYGPMQVLFDVDLRIEPGEMVALLGPNGVGKTTLLRVLSGLERPTAGSVRLRGRDVTGHAPQRRVAMGLSHVVGQASFPSMTVDENLRMHGYRCGVTGDDLRRAVDGALAVFPRLRERREQPASTLSGGERQMLALAKTLIQRPEVLLIDEFSLGLAPVVVGGLLELVRELNRHGVAVVLVEQSANIALSLVDRAYFLEKGRITAERRAADLRDEPELVRSLMLGGHVDLAEERDQTLEVAR